MAKTRLLTLITVTLLVFSGTALATIPQAYQDIAAQQQVPAEMLFAISLNESGKKLASKKIMPWPWTLNVAGKSYFYPTRGDACMALRQFVKTHSLKRIDVGLAQVNIGWNGQRFFGDHCDGFEPLENLRVASIILKQCYTTHKNWLNAAGCYHHPKGGTPAKRYKAGIRAKLARIERMSGNVSQQIAVTMPAPQHLAERPILTYSMEPAIDDTALTWIVPIEKPLVWVEPMLNQEDAL